MTKMASQITSLTVVYSTVYSDADQIKHQSSASLAFVWGIHRDRWIPRTKGQLRGKCFHLMTSSWERHVHTLYPKKYTHGFVVLCFVVVMQSFIINSHEIFIHIHQGCFAGTGAIVRLPQCQWSKPDGYGKISQCITTTKHSKAKTVCIFLGIYYRWEMILSCCCNFHCNVHGHRNNWSQRFFRKDDSMT